MLASIHPLGERGRGQHYGLTAGSYVAASMVGGAVTGVVLGLVGSLVFAVAEPSARTLGAVLIGAAGIGLLVEARNPAGRLPSWHRQVNEDWLTRYRGWVYGAGFGFQLGLGFVTFVTTATVYLLFILEFVTASWRWGLYIGLSFGLVRSAVALTVSRVSRPAQLHAVHRRLQSLAVPIQRVASGAQAAVAIVGALVVLT